MQRFVYLLFALLLLLELNVAYAASVDVTFNGLENKAVVKLLLDDEEYTPSVKWFKDGEEIQNATNKTELTVDFDNKDSINLKAILRFGANKYKVIQKNISKPKSFILWEPVSFVPFSFSLTPPVSDQAKIRAEFVSKDGIVPNKTLYLWYVNGNLRAEISGVGKNSAVLTLPPFEKGILVEVEAQDTLSLKKIDKASVYIEYQQPDILIYEKDKYGSWNFEPKKEIFLGTKKDILLLPFGLTYRFLFDDSLLWKIFVDDIQVTKTESAAPFLELRSKNKKNATLKAIIEHKKLDLQMVKSSLLIIQNRKNNDETDVNSSNADSIKSGFGI